MTTKLRQPFTLLILIFSLVAAGTSFAEEKNRFQFRELTLSNSQKELLLFGTIENSFRSEMAESLQNGISLDFIFFVELHKTTPNWPKELIKSTSFKHTISYDTLRDTYQVILEENNNRAKRFPSLREAQQATERINGAKIVALSQLIPGQNYQLRIRAELTQNTIELGANRILPLIKKKDIKTKWQIIEFTY